GVAPRSSSVSMVPSCSSQATSASSTYGATRSSISTSLRTQSGSSCTSVTPGLSADAMPLAHPLSPFVDPLTFPPRRLITEPARLAMRLETTAHRFHRDLPPSRVWTYEGHLPGPTIEVRRGVPLEVRWENGLSGTLPIVLTVAANASAAGVPVQCLPG